MRQGIGGRVSLAAAMAVAIWTVFPPQAGASPYFTRLGTREGLPNASVSGIAQDGDGFIWFGTQGGLARYDGYSFKLFGHMPFDDASLPHDQVQTIFLDGDRLWAGTYGGLARLDLATERFVSYANDSGREDSLSNDVVTCIARDSLGRLWVGTLSGLNLLDEATGKFTRFRHDPADPGSLPSDVVRALKLDRSGRLWVGTSGGGLALLDYADNRFRSYRKGYPGGASILSDYVMALDLDPSGRLWVGTWYGGLSLFNPETGAFENHPTADNRVYSLYAGEDGKVYVGTWGGGLFVYDIASASFARYRAADSPGALSNDVVYSMMRDSSGALWVGTNGGGVCKLDGGDRGLDILPAGPESFPPGKIYAALADRRGYLWVAVYNEGLARRDPSSGAWRRYRHDANDLRSLPNDIVNFIREDSSGALWIGTNDGLARYDRARDSFEVLRPVAGAADSLSSEIVFSMADDPRGGAWIGTFRTGLDHWSGGAAGSGAFVHYAHDGANPGSLSDNLVNAIGYDGGGRLWVGTNSGLDRLSTAGGAGSFVRYFYDPAKAGGISSDSIKTIFLDSRKLLWIGTAGGGLMRYEPETDSFIHFTRKDGLPSNTVLRVLEDGAGDLWVVTQTGLAVYDRANGRFRPIYLYSEERSSEFFAGAFRASDGRLYFGAQDRLYEFDPAKYSFNPHRPPIALSSISISGGPTIGATAASRLGRLDLSWRQSSVVFEFAALDYRDPARNRYSYRLEGFDANWSPAGPGHSATYTKLPGGRYTFRVKASNNDGLWNEEGLSLPVRVGFAPWAGPWAMLLYAILLGGGGYLIASASSRSALRAARLETDSLLAKLIDASASMESAAIVDALTGLPNRRKAEEHLELAFARAARMKMALSVLMVDIDNFKSYNDRFGKAAGDECLRSIAEVLSGIVRRSSDFVARYGGEEFLFVLEETGIVGALAKGEELRKAVEALEHPAAGEPKPTVTASVGCASIQPGSGDAPAHLISAAEKALMAAKQLGRNRSSA